jgi:CSLREA domain-containing protein
MTDPARLWTRCWNAFSKRLARALSPAVAGSLSASRAIVRPGLLVALLIVIAPVCLVLTQSGLHASGNTITVNNLTDPASTSGNNFCTLREAINNANAKSDTSGGDCAAGTGTDTINFTVSGTITVTQSNGVLTITNSSPGSLTIDGTGQTITVDGNHASTGFIVNTGATANLNLLTIANGQGNGDGAGIFSFGALTVTNCTFSGNVAPGSGGAIQNFGGTLTVSNSTFSGNSSNFVGGAIANGGGVNSPSSR